MITKLLSVFVMSAIFALSFVAAESDRNNAFVCPVFNSDSVGEHNPNAVPIGGGDYTILGPNVMVPVHATNQDGLGNPGGAHAGPGDSGYTPIWNLE